MVSAPFFDQFDKICQAIRKCREPFGGIQVIISGDFFQLPPILRDLPSDNSKVLPIEYNLTSSFLRTTIGKEYDANIHSAYSGRIDGETHYLFNSNAWLNLKKSGMKSFILNEAFRQVDEKFVALLDDLRYGICSDEMWHYLEEARFRHHDWTGKIRPTLLSAYRITADVCNQMELRKLTTKLHRSLAIDSVSLPENSRWTNFVDVCEDVDRDFDNLQSDLALNLKVGAQVILIRNLDVKKKLVNGARGVVVDFTNHFDALLERYVLLPVVLFESGSTYIIGYHEFGYYKFYQGLILGLEMMSFPCYSAENSYH